MNSVDDDKKLCANSKDFNEKLDRSNEQTNERKGWIDGWMDGWWFFNTYPIYSNWLKIH